MEPRVSELSYYVQVGKKQRCLLRSVSTKFAKSSVNVLMGHSGAGKTTLMDLVAGRKLDGIMCGKILIDGLVPADLPSLIAYVQSTDVHIGEFTVLENLYFAARLRLGSMFSAEECLRRCTEVAESLGLESALQVLVGSDLVKGISGGQKKRLSIGIELLAVPYILCLDEPTTGLDSSTSFQIAKILKELTTTHKTIICTVHQPSDDMLEIWDNLILLSSGQIVYSGPIRLLDDHLKRIGFRTPEYSQQNPVEFALELLAVPLHAQVFLDQHIECADAVAVANDPCRSDPPAANTFWNQVVTLSLRQGLYQWRSIHGIPAMLVRNIVGGLLFGILYFRNGRYLQNQQNIFDLETRYFTAYCANMQSLQFTTVVFLVAINAIAVPSMNSASLLFRREQASRLYSPLAYWTSTLLVDTTLLLIGSAMFSVMVSLMADVYGPDAIFYSILLLSAALGFSQAKLCALLSPDSQTAFIYFALLISLEMILSGFLIFPEDAPVYLKWTMDIMFSRWAVSGLLFNQFNNFKENGDIANGILSNQGELVLNLYGLSSYDIWKSIWILCVYLVGLEVLVIISVMPKINRLKLMTSLSDSSRLWNIEEEAVVASGTSQSLQIDLISNSNRDRDTLSSKSFFDRFSIAEAVGQVTPNLVEPYNRMTASSSQHDSQLLTSEGRLAPRLTHTEPRDSCRVSDVLEPYQRADLVFRNVSYTIKNKTEEVQLLRGVSGVVKSGELCAIMGSSGAGKTTLLNVLYGRHNVGSVTGDVLVNKVPFNGLKQTSLSQLQCAYVMQDDAHFPVLTIKETLTYAAMLRMRETSSESTIVKRAVDDTMELLGLKLISESYIGTSQERNISLGQLRRVTIGVEIVHRPSLIFLDEPTSGLDSYLASTVVDGLHILSRSQRTLCCTIHQPSAAVFEKFDKLLLLCNGLPLYFGPILNCRTHFENFGFFGDQPNPAEFVISVATNLAQQSRESVDSLKKYSESSVSSLSRADLALLQDSLRIPECESNTSQGQSILQKAIYSLQIAWILTHRDVTGMFRRRFWIAVTLRSCLFGVFLGPATNLLPSFHVLGNLFLGLLWRQTEGFLSVISFFFASFIATCVWVIEIVPGLHEEKIIFYRERAANATSTFSSWISIGLPTLFMSFIICAAFGLPAYYLSGLRPDLTHFVIYLSVLYLNVVIHIMIQYLCAALTPNAMIHTLIFPGLAIPYEALFCGYVVNISKMHSWYSWLVEIDPLRWYLNALFNNELQGNKDALGDVKFDDLQELYGWRNSISFCCFILVCIFLFLKSLSYFVMKYVDHSSS